MRFPNITKIRAVGACITVLLAQPFASAAPGDINTIAGNGTYTTPSYGGAATSSSIQYAKYIAVDPGGNLYISNQLEEIAYVDKATGIISHFAGDDEAVPAGDGGPATEAGFQSSYGIALDSKGNVYIVDHHWHVIRRVDAITGLISTYAGTYAPGYSGNGGPATAAKLDRPSCITIDRSDNLYFSDSLGTRIRRIDGETGHISTVAGVGYAGFGGDGNPAIYAAVNNVQGMTTDPAGNLYFADRGNHRIRKIDISTGLIATIAGSDKGTPTENVEALSAQFDNPFDVCLDGAGNLFISDHSNRCVRRLDASTNLVTTVAGTGVGGFSGEGGPATLATMKTPFDVAMDHAGNLYIADYTNYRVRMVENAGVPFPSAAGGAQAIDLVDRALLMRKMKKLKKKLKRAKQAGRTPTVRKLKKQIKKLKKLM